MNMVTRNPVLARMKNSCCCSSYMNLKFNRSMVTRIDDSEQQEEKILCLNVCETEEVGDTDPKIWRWYGVTPPANSSSKSAGGITHLRFITTSAQVDPSLLCEIPRCHLPRDFINVALDSKIHLIGDVREDNCLPQVLDIDTSSLQITAQIGQPMNTIKYPPRVVVLDGKIYAFPNYSCDNTLPAAEVFDPITNKWDHLPPLSVTSQHFNTLHPVVYDKAKKIFLFCNRRVYAFDVNTNSWEYGVEMPQKVLHHMALDDEGQADVIVDDILYMFHPFMFQSGHHFPPKFFAYDLRERQLLEVHGLERETSFLHIEDDWVGFRGAPIFLVQVGKKDMCLVATNGPVAGGLYVNCIKFRFEKNDGGLHAVFLGRDSYYILGANWIQGCVAV